MTTRARSRQVENTNPIFRRLRADGWHGRKYFDAAFYSVDDAHFAGCHRRERDAELNENLIFGRT